MMNDLGCSPSASVLRRSNSFEDETESLYHSDLLSAPRVNERGTQFLLENSGVVKVEADDCETMTTVNPSSITGQSLVMKMDDFDLDTFMNDQAGEPPPPAVEETQELIREMEDFLSQYEERGGSVPDLDDLAEQLLSMEQQQTLDSMDTSCPVTNGDLTSEDIAAAEKIIDGLFNDSPGTSDILAQAIESENLQDSGFLEEPFEETPFNVSNVTQFTTDEGNVIIVVAPPSNTTTEDSDSDWTPGKSVPRRKPGRKPAERHPLMLDGCKVTKKSYKTIKDRKERKKLQNVEAARRYRDKKKQQALDVENEEQTLLKKNRELKEQLKDVENEMKTMKKLMVELGLLKVVKR